MRTGIGKILTSDQVWQKIKYYCAYRERTHFETRQKLYGYGIKSKEVNELLSQLIEENYLNETRFATQFALGHFRIKKWGKIKIQYHLRQKMVSPGNIKIALAAIEQNDYLLLIEKLTLQKWNRLKQDMYITRYAKTKNALLQKGFESVLIENAIRNINPKPKS